MLSNFCHMTVGEWLDELDEGLEEYKQSKNKYINISQTIALYGVSGFFAGFSVGGSNAIVNNQSVISYALRTGGNCFVIGALVGGINESLAAVRGTRGPINPAIACGVNVVAAIPVQHQCRNFGVLIEAQSSI